jgi:hypothetical protein
MTTQYGMNNEVGNVTHNYTKVGKHELRNKAFFEKEVKLLLREKAYSNANTISNLTQS